jgi:serine/threonine-protein phosphatase PP1 catalytic subunit
MSNKDKKTIVIDDIIQKLLSVRGSRPGKLVSLDEEDIKAVIYKTKEIFQKQPSLVELEAPLKVCGTFIIDY